MTGISVMRLGLFLIGLAASLAWVRRRRSLALLAAAAAGLLGLAYWLLQLVTPLGFGTDPVRTREWAQAGVTSLAEPRGSGFVWGTDPEVSLVSALAAAGVPLHFVALTPQLAVVGGLGLLALLPFAFLRNRTDACFAASLAVGGGLWPGLTPYSAILLRPSELLTAGALLGAAALMLRSRRARAVFRRRRLAVGAGAIAAATLARAFSGGGEQGVAASLMLGGAGILLTPPLRGALRRITWSTAGARRIESLLLLCAIGGGGLLWWDPPGRVVGFTEATDRNVALLGSMAWIRENVPNTSVVLSSPTYSTSIAAFAGRRVLYPQSGESTSETSLSQPFRRARLFETAHLGQPVAKLAEEFSVTHLFLGPGEPDPPHAPVASDETRMSLAPVYRDARDFRVFALVKK